MFALLTYLLLAGGTARLATRLVSEDDALTRDTATVLWTWQVLTLAVAVLPSLPCSTSCCSRAPSSSPLATRCRWTPSSASA